MSITAPRRIHYAWIIAAATFLTMLFSSGTRSVSGLLILPLEAEFGWSRTTISLAASLNMLLFGLMGPFSAALIDRFGVRTVMMSALTVSATGVALSPLMTESWQLVLLWGLMVGGGTGMTALSLGATVVNRWFSERRGLVTGLLTASTATGQLVFLPLLAQIVESYGWRSAVLGVACVALFVIPMVGIFVRNRPSDIGLRPYGETGPATLPAAPTGPRVNPAMAAINALRDGVKHRDFWLLFVSFFICGASTNGLIGTHMIAACFDQGIPEVKAAGLLALMGIFDLIGTTGAGWMSDRWSNRTLLFWYYALRGISLVFLPFSFDMSFYGLSLFAVFYGLDWIATVPPTVRLAADTFGRERAGLMFGWIFCGHQLGAATAAYVAGYMRVELDRYLEAFILSGLLCAIAAVLSLMVGRRPAPARVVAPA